MADPDVPHLPGDGREHPRMGREVGHHHVAAHRDDPAGEGPDVQVVHGDDPLDALHPPLDVLQRDVRRGRLEQDLHALPQEPPTAGDDEERDEHRHDRVGQGPSGKDDDQGSEERPNRAQEVAHHVQVRGARIQVPVRVVPKQSERNEVHHQARQGHAGEEGTLNDVRGTEPPDRLEDDPGREGGEDDTVHQRGKDLEAEIAVGAARVGGTPGHARREERQGERARHR